MEGFFISSSLQSNKRKPIPQQLKVKFPDEVKKPKKDKPELSENQMIFDIECYQNYFLAKFMRMHDERIYAFERLKGHSLDVDLIKRILKRYEIITFNGNRFDIPLLNLALSGASNKALKEATDELIKTDIQIWQFEQKHNLEKLNIKHIDLKELCPANLSLKLLAGRLHCEKMQDLPYPEESELTEEQMDDVSEYNDNDLINTKLIYLDRFEQIELRRVMSKKYNLDLCSKSDAQIAEAVIKAEVEKITGKKIEKGGFSKKEFHYKTPKFIKFKNPRLNELLEIYDSKPFTINDKGKTVSPKELQGFKVKIGSSTYTTGKGGLHSTEKSAFHTENNHHSIFLYDVTSYYPQVILNCGLYPKQLGKAFIPFYGGVVTERVEAKSIGDKVKADVLKILLNGSFGKLGQLYSILYAPDLMLQVTITGQLAILMLIDRLERKGISVISGNTDGIVIKCPKDKEDLMQSMINRWMKETEFELTCDKYIGVYSRDINNYLGIKHDGSVTRKGIFGKSKLAKTPMNEVCSDAMIEYIKFGIPFEETIRKCEDIKKFLTVVQVNGGAVKNRVYLGKAVRFYISTKAQGCIEYKTTGNKVGGSDNAQPLMTLPKTLPNDIDYNHYVNCCYDLFVTKKQKE